MDAATAPDPPARRRRPIIGPADLGENGQGDGMDGQRFDERGGPSGPAGAVVTASLATTVVAG
jgi:hypothetical protein